MKRIIILTAIVFGFLATTLNAKTIYRSDIDINYFYCSLEPYGEWIEIGYDDFVWRPYKSDYNWRPYADGRWEWTRNGWYWVSYEPFGWATYHYGRWYFDDYYGWVWMPDNVWAPAWVEWRYNDNYIGWAPLPPYASFNNRKGIHFSINWHSGHVYWNFVSYNHFISYNIHNHYVDRNYVKEVFGRTKYRTNYFAENDRIVNGGVSRRFVERKIGKKFTTKSIVRTNKFDDYNTKDIKKRDGIVDYRPSESKMKSATFDRKKVVKGKQLQSLKTDKIAINRRNVEKNNSDSNIRYNRNGTIKKENDTRIEKKSKVPSDNRTYTGKAKDNKLEKSTTKAESSKSVEKKRSTLDKKYENKSNSSDEKINSSSKIERSIQKGDSKKNTAKTSNNNKSSSIKKESVRKSSNNKISTSRTGDNNKRESVTKERVKNSRG